MLFDLQGKRRRVVQATYLMLALLMGGGLVFCSASAATCPAGCSTPSPSSGGGGGNGNSVIEKRIERNEEKRRGANPRSEAARKALVRDYYQLATAQTTDSTTGFPDEAKDELRRAAANWQAYLALEPEKVDASLAGVALQIYDPTALNKPKEAQEAARLIAEAREQPNAYLRLVVQYAALAGDNRTADLAGQKAVDLAPKAAAQGGRGAGGAAEEAADRRRRRRAPPPVASARRYSFAAGKRRYTENRRSVNFHIQDEEIDAQTHVIELGGEIDLYTAPEFKERMVELIEDGKKRIVVDLSEGHLHRLHHARRAGRRGQAPAPGGRRARAGLHRPEHHQDLRDHRARPGLPDPREPRRGARVAQLAGLAGRVGTTIAPGPAWRALSHRQGR